MPLTERERVALPPKSDSDPLCRGRSLASLELIEASRCWLTLVFRSPAALQLADSFPPFPARPSSAKGSAPRLARRAGLRTDKFRPSLSKSFPPWPCIPRRCVGKAIGKWGLAARRPTFEREGGDVRRPRAADEPAAGSSGLQARSLWSPHVSLSGSPL